MHVVVVGNALDGLTLYGPFFDLEDVVEFGEATGAEWHSVELRAPWLSGDGGGERNPLPVGLFTGSIEAALNDEALVTLWPDGEVEVAFRQGLESWGPPVALEKRETR